MLPTQPFEKTNFSDGMVFNPSQIKESDEYFSFKTSLLARYGVGQGVLIGFGENLRVSVENGQMFLHPGAAINQNGDVIYVDKKTLILKDLLNAQFSHRNSVYVYVKYNEVLEDFKASRSDKDVKLYYKISESFSVEIREKSTHNDEMFELARIYIDHESAQNISNPINPYSPIENEIDFRFSPKIIPANTTITQRENIMISNILRKYGDYLTEMAYSKSVFTASIAASFSNKIVGDLKIGDLSAWKLYDLLSHLLYVSSKIKDEKAEIINTGFWKNILRLQSLFSFSERFEADYYDSLLNIDNSFFSKVLLHFSNASIIYGSWDDMMQGADKTADKAKEFYLAGASQECDLHIQGDDIEQEHARLYPYKDGYFIEDISNSSGIYINAQRLESGMKKFIRNQDFVTLGKNGKVVNLNNL